MKYLKEAWSRDKIDFIITTLWILFFIYMIPVSYDKYMQKRKLTALIKEKNEPYNKKSHISR